ncbi:MAG: hypothetical protein AVDCRST_MAG72-1870, partial [uncultured Nocardioidaceae bacterium]
WVTGSSSTSPRWSGRKALAARSACQACRARRTPGPAG